MGLANVANTLPTPQNRILLGLVIESSDNCAGGRLLPGFKEKSQKASLGHIFSTVYTKCGSTVPVCSSLQRRSSYVSVPPQIHP